MSKHYDLVIVGGGIGADRDIGRATDLQRRIVAIGGDRAAIGVARCRRGRRVDQDAAGDAAVDFDDRFVLVDIGQRERSPAGVGIAGGVGDRAVHGGETARKSGRRVARGSEALEGATTCLARVMSLTTRRVGFHGIMLMLFAMILACWRPRDVSFLPSSVSACSS